MDRLLVAIDGSDHAWKALDRAMDYGEAKDAQVIVLHVVPLDEVPKELEDFAQIEHVEPGDAVSAWRKRVMLEDKIMTEAKARLHRRRLQNFKCIILEGDPGTRILGVADEQNADMIFIGHRGLSQWQSMLLGSVAHKVVQLARQTCVVVK